MHHAATTCAFPIPTVLFKPGTKCGSCGFGFSSRNAAWKAEVILVASQELCLMTVVLYGVSVQNWGTTCWRQFALGQTDVPLHVAVANPGWELPSKSLVSERLRSPFLSAGLCFLGILTRAVGTAGPGGWMVLSSVLHLKHEPHNVPTEEAALVFEGETCPLHQRHGSLLLCTSRPSLRH